MAVARIKSRLLAAATTLACGAQAVFGAELIVSGSDYWGVVEAGNIYQIVAKGERQGFEIKASSHANLSAAKSPPSRQGAATALAWLSDQFGVRCADGAKPKIVMASEQQTDTGWRWMMSPDCRQGSR